MISFLGSAQIQAQGEKIKRTPEVANKQNSQTMNLLEGHLNLRPTAVHGSELAVVDGSALVSEAVNSGDFGSEGFAGNGQISTYIVREGDTLSTIAKMFGVSVNTITWANDITGGRISPGQSLVILPISGVKHVVVKGDTLQSIAKKYKADMDDLLSYNGLSAGAKLALGDEVIVPDGEVTSIVSSSMPSGSYSGVAVKVGYFLRPISLGKKSQGIHGHNGIDLGGLPIGASVVASADGAVIVSKSGGWNGGYGSYVVISHSNGTQTLYAHLNTVNVSQGAQVSQGQVIGSLGNTGKSTGPHLHFEVRGAKNPF